MSPQITVVSLSPSVDKRMELDRLALGSTNRVQQSTSLGGGKGINVSMAAQTLGLPVHAIGLLPQDQALITARLDAHRVSYDFLPMTDPIRVNQKLFDKGTGVTTEINEPMCATTSIQRQALEAAVLSAARAGGYVVFTGSLPQNWPADWYAQMLLHIREEAPACRCILDADGPRLAAGVGAYPWLIKPNRDELFGLVQAAGSTLSAIAGTARALVAKGCGQAVVSLGADGAIAADATGAWHVAALPVDVHTTTGAGDAMVAGLLHGFAQGAPLADALRHGVAAASARCASVDDVYLSRQMFEACLAQTAVTAL